MAKGSKRNKVDVAFVSTGIGKGNVGAVHQSENECPLSFRIEIKQEDRGLIGMKIRAQANKNEVSILYEQKEIVRLSGSKGMRIAKCIKEGGYRYEGTVVRIKGKSYAQLQIA